MLFVFHQVWRMAVRLAIVLLLWERGSTPKPVNRNRISLVEVRGAVRLVVIDHGVP